MTTPFLMIEKYNNKIYFAIGIKISFVCLDFRVVCVIIWLLSQRI